MKIIISPAKKMNVDRDTYCVSGLPVFLEKTELLLEAIQKLSFQEAQSLWKCNEKLAQLNYQRFREMQLRQMLTPAVLSYEGIQYQHMAPKVFTESALEYMEETLRILSGFYGILKPFDGVTPYRLEMQAKLSVIGKKDLYDFWGDALYRQLTAEDNTIVNLASREYAKAIEKYLAPGIRFLTVEFGEQKDGRIKQKATLAKMARGEMVRFMAENKIREPEGIRDFRELGFHYEETLSTREKYVFVTE